MPRESKNFGKEDRHPKENKKIFWSDPQDKKFNYINLLFDDIKIAPSEKEEKSLLFVVQTQGQQQLLNRYGNDLCLLDATYKTTKYDIPLFFPCVKTNVKYEVVAAFVIQYETTNGIAEALSVIKDWSSNWSPSYFMTDFPEEEIGATE